MAKCKKIQRKETKVCTGSLNKRITIYTRDIEPPTNPYNNDIDYDEKFVVLATVWSMVVVYRGSTIFDQIETNAPPMTDFYIRYRSDITSENWIVYNNNRYDILEVENLDDNNLYLALRTTKTGSTDKDGSKT